MIRELITSSLTLVLVLSCQMNNKKSNNDDIKNTETVVRKEEISDTMAQDKYFIIEQDSILVLPFEIAVNLSPKAKDKILKDHETIIVAVSFTGEPKASTPSDFFSEDGLFYVASERKEINYGQNAKFDQIKFSTKVYNELSDKDIDVTVNVYSGRKSSEYNLLNCELLYDKISHVVNKKFTLNGKLIYGDD
jgi:hypothetical protein